MHRTYENDDIVVFWNSDKCFHAKKCVGGCPTAFNPTKRPWINIKDADSKEVWQAISQCPSGALSCLYRHNIDIVMDADKCRSIAYDGDKEIGECNYAVTENGWNIYHTGVADAYSGKGIARRLVYKVIEESERRKADITATCSYARKILEQ